MANLILENGLSTMAFARQNTMGFLEDIPEDKVCFQVCPGANHAMWVLGHLATTDDHFLSSVGGKESRCGEKYKALFGMGSTPTGSPSDYPPIDEIKEIVHERREALAAWFGSMSEEQLAQPLSGDAAFFAANHGALMSTIAWHEGLHSGQLTMIRKALGIKPKMG